MSRKAKSATFWSLLSLFFIMSGLQSSPLNAKERNKKFSYQLSYQRSDADDKQTNYNTDSNFILQTLTYERNPKLTFGGALTFNKSEGKKTGEGSNDVNLYGGTGFASRMVAPGLTLTGLIGYFKGDGDFTLTSAPSVSNNLDTSVITIMAMLNQFIPLSGKWSTNLGVDISGNRLKVDEVKTSTSTTPSRTNTLTNGGLSVGLTYLINKNFSTDINTRASHSGGRTGSYITWRPKLSLGWNPSGKSYGAGLFYGLVSGQKRKENLGGFNLSYNF